MKVLKSLFVFAFNLKATNFPSDQTISYYTVVIVTKAIMNSTYLVLECDTCIYLKSNADFTIYF